MKSDRPGIRFQANGSSRLEIWCVEKLKCAKLNVAFDGVDVSRAPQHSHDLFDARVVSQRAGDGRSISTIKHWLSVCKSSHPKCSTWASLRGARNRHLPTRVLDVGDTKANRVKLYIPADSDTSEYIALSYCWGRSGNPYYTDQANLQRHISEGIELSSLPLTLRDTIELTRQLGVKYLWIDALCIIQKDRDDWIHEASLMSAVYSQALFCISADASADTSSGIFLDRSARHGTSVALPWPLEDPNDGLGPMVLHITPDFRSFKDEILTSPLAKRGWTFQERALSARIIHFGSELCYWECKEACIGENEEIGKYSVQDGFFNLKDMLLTSSESSKPKLHDKWAWVISQFSSRQLTNASDSFAALEGVATMFGDKNKLGKYYCGLWGDEFLRHLLWSSDRTSSGSLHDKPAVYRAPSWSWAAVQGPVTNPAIEIFFKFSPAGIEMTEELGSAGLLSHKILKIRQIKVETEGRTGFGPVIEALLQVTGSFYPIKIGAQLSKGIFTINLADDRAVGVATWDIDEVPDGSVPYWLSPVMQRKESQGGWEVSECLVLCASSINYGGELTFERVGKGKATNFWTNTAIFYDFTIL
ncbi:HET-domain-containing protein [Melanomma pulvis-pyrius CBS 109.77]|uniref:HET-domain-containing protein n=1 Tax=Melanomma pulvis-pyrius CBS 109.77 TaxID=1314802 RepID=A0A6A6WZK1_9PLEO|nr:HET-domain-containing protein [Melanomma pulvis-pyrius CBS 109.77]